jgi:hypothetical protein
MSSASFRPSSRLLSQTLRAGYEDLAHLRAAGEFDYGLRNILAAKDLRLDPKVAGKAPHRVRQNSVRP